MRNVFLTLVFQQQDWDLEVKNDYYSGFHETLAAPFLSLVVN